MIDEKKREYNRKWHEANRERTKQYREGTKEQRNARRREVYRTDEVMREQLKAAARNGRLKAKPFSRRARMYGITPAFLELEINKGCAICKANPMVDPTVKLHVDHDHNSGKFRGVLCQRCNLAIGHMNDDPTVAAAMLEYLRNNGAKYE